MSEQEDMSLFNRVASGGIIGHGTDESHPSPIGQRSNNAPASLLGLLLALVILILVVVTVSDYISKSAIQRHGERQEAKVINVREVRYHGYRHESCNVYGDLVFTPHGWDHLIELRTNLSGCYDNSRAISYANQYHTLPIAYDTTNPTNTLLNFDDEVFRENTGANLRVRILLIACVASICVFIFTLLSMVRRN